MTELADDRVLVAAAAAAESLDARPARGTGEVLIP
jgi:hypothetical protein